jgi:hypothetical protein
VLLNYGGKFVNKIFLKKLKLLYFIFFNYVVGGGKYQSTFIDE